MKLSITYKIEESRESVEKETARHAAKLETLLEHYAPDLVKLHGGIEKHPRKKEYLFSLTLSLPTGTLHATGEGADVRNCVKVSFAELESQVKKHKSLVRKDYQWKRKSPRAKALA